MKLEQLRTITKYEKFTDLFSDWLQQRVKSAKGNSPLAIEPTIEAKNHLICICEIDSENPFTYEDVGKNTRIYLERGVKGRAILLDCKRVCLPFYNAVILSRKEALSDFANLCRTFDSNDPFSTNMELQAESRRLNEAEDSMADAEYLKLLRGVRQHVKQALGKPAYTSYINLLNQSGMDSARFLNELLQNADDCEYADDVIPQYDFWANGTEIKAYYNETGFTRKNVRAITAIGESTKKSLVNNSVHTIGEKGIGFKSVFAIAKDVTIHSGGFHFKLTQDEPTIPGSTGSNIADMAGTMMEINLEAPLQGKILQRDNLLSLCLCLRKLKKLKFNETQIEISDAESVRTIKIGNDEYHFDIFTLPFIVND